jgi:limiting CO2-inducible B/C-like protein
MVQSRTHSLPLRCLRKSKYRYTQVNSSICQVKAESRAGTPFASINSLLRIYPHSENSSKKENAPMPTLSAPISPSKINHPESFDFMKNLEGNFPGAYPSDAFVEYSQFRLHPFGINQKNSIACVSVCRDEIATPLMNRLHNA